MIQKKMKRVEQNSEMQYLQLLNKVIPPTGARLQRVPT